MDNITIIGAGLAGYTLAREIRKLNKDCLLRIIAADNADFYSKPMLSNAFNSGKTPASLVMKSASAMALELNAEICAYCSVQSIELADKVLHLADGRTLSYEKLVFACGANPINLPFAGTAATKVLQVNDLASYATFRAQLPAAGRVALIGAGLIGCEFANDLASGGYHVSLIDPSAWPLSRLLPAEAGAYLQDALEAAGVQTYLGHGIVAINQAEHAVQLSLTQLESQATLELTVDVVLSAVGLMPNTALAKLTGIACGRGIQVNHYLETSQTGVYALGDCAEVQGLVLPFILPIMYAARALAKTLTGEPSKVQYPAMPVMVKTPACPTVVAPPALHAVGAWQVESTEQGLRALFKNAQGELLGLALLGETSKERQQWVGKLPAVLVP